MFELLLFDSIFAANELFNPGCSGTYSTCTNSACGNSTNTSSCTNSKNKCEGSTDKLKCYS